LLSSPVIGFSKKYSLKLEIRNITGFAVRAGVSGGAVAQVAEDLVNTRAVTAARIILTVVSLCSSSPRDYWTMWIGN